MVAQQAGQLAAAAGAAAAAAAAATAAAAGETDAEAASSALELLGHRALQLLQMVLLPDEPGWPELVLQAGLVQAVVDVAVAVQQLQGGCLPWGRHVLLLALLLLLQASQALWIAPLMYSCALLAS